MRLLIVDDEHYIVSYMASLIEEHIPSDLEVYKCYSGPSALKLLETVHIDILLLDINMPGMSGLELAPKVSELLPECHIIFLTAYDNFDYIYHSAKSDRTHYLLKTESDDVILNEINRIIDKINEESSKMALLSNAEQKTVLLSHLLQQNILKALFAGQQAADLDNEWALTGSDFTLDFHQPVYLMYTQIRYKTLNESNLTTSAYTLQYLLLARKLLAEKFRFSMLDMGKGTLFWFFQPAASFPSEFEFLKNVANDFADYCNLSLHRPTTAVLYPTASDWDDICMHFHSIQKYAESFVSEVPLIYSPAEEDSAKSTIADTDLSLDRVTIDHQIQELSFYLYQTFEKEYFTVLNELRSTCVSIKSMHSLSAIRIYNSVSLMLLNYIDLYNLQEKIVSKIALYPLYYLQDFTSWQDSFQYLETLSGHIFEILSSKKTDKNERLVNKIKLYIDEHLAESLTLTAISRLVNYNEAYVSRLFKQLTGQGLSEYISQTRIEKARLLLTTTSDSVQNIAASTGFDTAQYFSIVFKKIIGVSPSEYRRLHLQ